MYKAAVTFVSGSVVAFGRVGDVFLFGEGEVREGVGDGVSSAESDDDARGGWRVGEGYVAAGV